MVSERRWETGTCAEHPVASDKAFAKAFAASPLPQVLIRASDRVFIASNDEVERCFGYSPNELIGRGIDEVAFHIPSAQRDAAVELRTKNGDIRSVIWSVVGVDIDGEATLLAVAQDISERLRLENELRQVQKMESLGLLAGGVAHDFNNVLAVIAACNGLLGDDIAKDHPSREFVDEIDAAIVRASSLTRQLLAFSRKQVTDPKVVELNVVVTETHKMLRRIIGDDIVLAMSLEPDLAHVRVDPGYLVQVLMNLAVNARDAMPRGGTLSLTTRNAVIGSQHVRRSSSAKPGPAVLLEVRDTGIGMTADVLARIFEPFFTTKSHGKGTGMGLAVVDGIIDQAGGLIDVESTLGVGTTFRVYLPALGEAVAPPCEITSSLARGVEHILLVDDDDHVRRSTARALRARGYTVVEASGGTAALAQLDHRRFDLLLTDVVMPGMDGRQLAEAALARCPLLRILYTSGFADDAVVRHGVMHGQVELIEKPFRIDALALRVRQVLDRPLPAESAGSCEICSSAAATSSGCSRS